MNEIELIEASGRNGDHVGTASWEMCGRNRMNTQK